MSSLCACICGPSFELACSQIEKVRGLADILELRVHLFDFFSLEQLCSLREKLGIPIILTFRSNVPLELILDLKPEYVDIEWGSPPALFKEMALKLPKTTIICSLHNFEQTPQDLDSIADEMVACPAGIYKIATMGRSALDVMRMLLFVKKRSKEGRKWIGICMGEMGQFGRILGPIAGNAITYGAPALEWSAAPGQLDLHALVEIYRCHQMNRKTQLLGLIGNPVKHSLSYKTHNAHLAKSGINGVYVKADVTAAECSQFLSFARDFGFQGLSVTMPLKEVIMKNVTVDAAAAQMGAVNTLVFNPAGVKGYNTDGDGALATIQKVMAVKGKRIVLLGAGGAAKAIAYVLRKAGGHLVFLNRTLEKAQALAERFEGESGTLEDFGRHAKRGYDLLINCTCVGMKADECPIDAEALLLSRVVMEIISVPKETKLVRAALQRNCPIIYGFDMFMEQAKRQFALWRI